MADRSEYVVRTTEVVHVAAPWRGTKEHPPHLWDLREFVNACEGLPGRLPVQVERASGNGKVHFPGLPE